MFLLYNRKYYSHTIITTFRWKTSFNARLGAGESLLSRRTRISDGSTVMVEHCLDNLCHFSLMGRVASA